MKLASNMLFERLQIDVPKEKKTGPKSYRISQMAEDFLREDKTGDSMGDIVDAAILLWYARNPKYRAKIFERLLASPHLKLIDLIRQDFAAQNKSYKTRRRKTRRTGNPTE